MARDLLFKIFEKSYYYIYVVTVTTNDLSFLKNIKSTVNIDEIKKYGKLRKAAKGDSSSIIEETVRRC